MVLAIRIVALVVLTVVFAAGYAFIQEPDSLSFGGSPGSEDGAVIRLALAAAVSVIAGVLAKSLYDTLGLGSDSIASKVARALSLGTLIRALIVSPVIVGLIYGEIAKLDSVFLLFLISFQNGFFFQSVLQKKEG